MHCLIVGGTGFLGGAMADAVAAAGHRVTILVRGDTVRPGNEDVETIRADRYGDLRMLHDRDFDWVFDSCAYTPDAVTALLDAVGGGIKRYVMISSISAYGTFAKRGLTEDDPAPDATPDDYAVARSVPIAKRASAFGYGASYGPLKRACEIAAAERLGDRATALRVGLLVGAGDYTDRLTWWARRIDEARGVHRHVPAPGPAERAVQLIDVRDAALFALRCAEDDLGGIWNVTGRPMPFGDLMKALVDATDAPAEIAWVDEQAVLDAGVSPWTDFPLMAPSVPEFRYFLEVDTERVRAAGLRCRPLIETLSPLIDWDRGRRDQSLKCGLTPAQEALLLG